MVTSPVSENVFLSLRARDVLFKKTGNQDDISAYHLNIADAHVSPINDVTFVDWDPIGPKQPGTGAIDLTALPGECQAAIDF